MTHEPGWYLAEKDGETLRLAVPSDWRGWFHTVEGTAHQTTDLTNIRPVIALDPDDDDVKACVEDWSYFGGSTPMSRVADMMAAQIPTPPHVNPPEPTGRWAVITDTNGTAWLRSDLPDNPWWCLENGFVDYADNIEVARVDYPGIPS